MVATDLEVERVVPWRDFQRAAAELELDPLVGDHIDLSVDDRHTHARAHELPVALVGRIDGDGHVAEHRRRAHGRDRDRPPTLNERIADRGEMVDDRLVHHLEIGDRGRAARAPVDDAVGPVEPATLVQAHEELEHRLRVALVHREPLAPVVERGAQAAVLAHDDAAVLLEPGPDALEERLTSELVP